MSQLVASVKRFKDPAALALIAAITIAAGILNHSFIGFPKGYDAYGHMSKIKLLVDYFPNTDWNHEWYAGMLYSEGSFPPLFHYVGGFLVGVFGLSEATAEIVIAAVSFVLIGWGLYGVVRIATGDHLAALAAALLLTGSAGYWAYIVEGGLYPRIVGMAFMASFAFFAVLYYQRGARPAYVAMVLSMAGALSSHLLIGAIAVAFALLTIAALPRPLGQRIGEAGKLLVPTLLVVAYFYLPYALQRPSSVPLFTRAYQQLSLSALFVPGTPGGQFESLPFFLLPAAIALPVAGLLLRRTPGQQLSRRLLVVVGLAAAASLAYAFVGLPTPGEFIYNFQPGQALFFASWFLAAVAGLTLGALRPTRLVGAGLVVALVAFVLVTAPDVARGEINGDNAVKGHLQASLNVDPSEKQFRVGVSWDGGSDWINSRSDIPQTRGYQGQGVLHADWQYYLETAVWSPRPNYEEKNFLLDWYAVGSLYGGPDPGVVQQFESRPDLYAPLSPDLPPGARTFRYVNATPILSARSTRTALVVGSDASYTLILKALALAGFDSRSLIPIRGGQYLDDHSSANLAQFDQIILYGYSVHDPTRAAALLRNYVQHGGGVVMEANNSPFEEVASAPEPIPGTQIRKTGIGPAWHLAGQQNPITAGIDLAAFAPASYQGGPWGVSYIPPASLRSWAEPVLLSEGRPVLVAGVLGQGRLVWSGLNLPFHAVSNQVVEESRLLSQEIVWASPRETTAPAFSAEFVNPQLSRIRITSPATGVLFKESSFPNWHASVNGSSAQVYQAGPDFMYVPLGKDVAYPAQVILEFTRSAVEWLGDAISVVALVALLAYAAAGFRRRRPSLPTGPRR
jgi:hypothetical protein